MTTKALAFMAGYNSSASMDKEASRKIHPNQASLLQSIFPNGDFGKNVEAADLVKGTEAVSSIKIDNDNLITGTDKG